MNFSSLITKIAHDLDRIHRCLKEWMEVDIFAQNPVYKGLFHYLKKKKSSRQTVLISSSMKCRSWHKSGLLLMPFRADASWWSQGTHRGLWTVPKPGLLTPRQGWGKLPSAVLDYSRADCSWQHPTLHCYFFSLDNKWEGIILPKGARTLIRLEQGR